jgi:hypothetical protein
MVVVTGRRRGFDCSGFWTWTSRTPLTVEEEDSLGASAASAQVPRAETSISAQCKSRIRANPDMANVTASNRVALAEPTLVRVGVSVDSAVGVAKDAADVVLLDKDLGIVADGVVEGRRIFANTIKYVLMGTSSNFGNIFTAAGASLFLSFLPMLPTQILLNNLLYDVSEMTIPTDNVDEDSSRGPRTGISA